MAAAAAGAGPADAPGGAQYKLATEFMPGHEGGVRTFLWSLSFDFPPSSFISLNFSLSPIPFFQSPNHNSLQVKAIAVLSENTVVSGGDDRMVTVWHRLAGSHVSC